MPARSPSSRPMNSSAAASQLPLKSIVDEALALGGCDTIRDVIVYKRTGGNIAFKEGRDTWLHDLVDGQAAECEPEWVERRAPAVHPLHVRLHRHAEGRPALPPAVICCGPR